jgi:excisionase family DNA binding protein
VTGRIQAGEAAALLGVSRRMVLKLIADGRWTSSPPTTANR